MIMGEVSVMRLFTSGAGVAPGLTNMSTAGVVRPS